MSPKQRGQARATETTLRRKKRFRLIQREIAEADRAEKGPVAATILAQAVFYRTQSTTDTGAAATPSPLTQPVSVYAWTKRLGDDVFFLSSVPCIAPAPKQEFPQELGATIVETLFALLQSVRRISLLGAELLSVAKTLSDMENSSYQGQTRATPRPSASPSRLAGRTR